MYNKNIRILIIIIILAVLAVSPLMAYSRLSIGGSYNGISLKGSPMGAAQGQKTVSTMGPSISMEAEIVPVEQFSIFMRALVNPFNMKISANGTELPDVGDEKVLAPYNLTGTFAFGLGWQMPFSDWTRKDVPIDLTLGLGAVMNYVHMSYSTRWTNFSLNEISAGLGTFVGFSVYFSPSVGLSLSSMPSLTVLDYSSCDDSRTGGETVEDRIFSWTPLEFSWDASLYMTIRFGY